QRVGLTVAGIHGGTTKAVAIWQISRTRIRFSPGATAKLMTAIRKVLRSARFPAAQVRSEWRTWPAMFGNGVSTISKPIAVATRSIREGRPRERSAFIAGAVGNRA